MGGQTMVQKRPIDSSSHTSVPAPPKKQPLAWRAGPTRLWVPRETEGRKGENRDRGNHKPADSSRIDERGPLRAEGHHSRRERALRERRRKSAATFTRTWSAISGLTTRL